jgi:hypothetical protein
MSIAALLVSGALVLAQEAAPPQTGTAHVDDLPVSLDHIREGLERPAGDRLRLRVVVPDFAVKVVERERFEKLVPPWDFRSGPVPPGGLYGYEQLQRAGLGFTQPLVSMDLLAIGRGIAGAISGARSAHAAAAARDDVQRAIAEYCAAQPNAGAGIQLCAPSPAIR